MSEVLNVPHSYNHEKKQWEADGSGYVVNSDGSNKVTPDEVKGMQRDLSSHLAESANLKHKAKEIGLEDKNNNFVNKNIEGAMNELFTNVSNGKSAIATAITGKDSSVTLPNNSSFEDLANGIGKIKSLSQGIVGYGNFPPGANLTPYLTPLTSTEVITDTSSNYIRKVIPIYDSDDVIVVRIISSIVYLELYDAFDFSSPKGSYSLGNVDPNAFKITPLIYKNEVVIYSNTVRNVTYLDLSNLKLIRRTTLEDILSGVYSKEIRRTADKNGNIYTIISYNMDSSVNYGAEEYYLVATTPTGSRLFSKSYTTRDLLPTESAVWRAQAISFDSQGYCVIGMAYGRSMANKKVGGVRINPSTGAVIWSTIIGDYDYYNVPSFDLYYRGYPSQSNMYWSAIGSSGFYTIYNFASGVELYCEGGSVNSIILRQRREKLLILDTSNGRISEIPKSSGFNSSHGMTKSGIFLYADSYLSLVSLHGVYKTL